MALSLEDGNVREKVRSARGKIPDPGIGSPLAPVERTVPLPRGRGYAVASTNGSGRRQLAGHQLGDWNALCGLHSSSTSGTTPGRNASDINDDGPLKIVTDPSGLLDWLFRGSSAGVCATPGSAPCGLDPPSSVDVSREEYAHCWPQRGTRPWTLHRHDAAS